MVYLRDIFRRVAVKGPSCLSYWVMIVVKTTGAVLKNILFLFMLFSTSVYAVVFKCVEDGRVVYSAEPCGRSAVQLQAGSASPVRSVTLKVDSSGTFSGRGVVGTVPVQFVADTGASYTTVSGRVAYASGHRTCEASGITATANGFVADCAINVNLDIGGIEFPGYRVKVLQNMPMDMLLGMDILRKLHVEQNEYSMILSR